MQATKNKFCLVHSGNSSSWIQAMIKTVQFCNKNQILQAYLFCLETKNGIEQQFIMFPECTRQRFLRSLSKKLQGTRVMHLFCDQNKIGYCHLYSITCYRIDFFSFLFCDKNEISISRESVNCCNKNEAFIVQ